MARLIRGQEIGPEERAALDAGWLDLAAVLEAAPVRDREVALIQSDAPARPGQIDAAKTRLRDAVLAVLRDGPKAHRADGPAEAAAWRQAAPALAAWTWERLVNRADAFGQYRPLDQRNGKGNAFIQKAELTPATLRRHFEGRDVGHLIGLFSTTPAEEPDGSEVSRWLGIDIDRHGSEGDPTTNERYALALAEHARDFTPLLLDSNGQGGYHLLIVFAAPRPTADVFAFGRWLLRDWQDHGLAKEPETFPKQPMLGKGKGFGNWLRLPGRHHTLPHWTRVYDLVRGAWLDGTRAIKYILSHQGTTEPIPAEAKEAASEAPTAGPDGKPGQNDVASPERNGKAPKAAPTPSDLDWASEAIQHLGPAYRDDYDQWLKVGLALAGLGSAGLALWDDWSRQSPKYEEGCCAAKWHSFTPDHGLTLGSLYHWAKAAGWPGPQGRLRCAARSGDAVARPDPEAVLRRILADGHLIELLSEWGLEPRAEAGRIEITWGPGRAAVVTPYTGRCHDAFKTLEFFELAVRCGAYPNEGTAVTALAARFGVQADEQEGADGDEVPTEAVRRDADGFESRGGRLGRWKRVPKEGWDWTPLANFDARVVEEVAQTIGASERRVFLIRASRPQPTGGIEHREVEVDAGDFDGIGWVTKQLGAAWSVGSGRTCKDQVREAIQRLSALDGIAQHTRYGHTGWVERDGKAYYLHAGGAIGADGPAEGFRVELAKLPLYALPAPAEGAELRQAVRASLRILELGAADHPNAQGIAAVLAALPWRAVLRPCPFAVAFVGGSGSRKTTCGCLTLQHFAPGHSYDVPPPASWAATAAQIEYLQHISKDSLLLLDNFIADGPDQAREQAKAATVLNNQGDGRGRSRMRPDMTPMPELPPRGSVLSTGEDCAQRRSAQGRSLVVKFTPEGETGSGQAGSIDLGTLTKLQAEAGLYAQAMAAYVRHLARDRAAALERLDALTAEYKARAQAAGVQGHARTPGILADLAAGFGLFAEWAASEAVGALQAETLPRLLDTHWSWLLTLADDQQERQEEADDAKRFVDLILSALGSGRAYLVDARGKPPEGRAAACGWTRHQDGGPNPAYWEIGYHPSVRLGWLDAGRVYLDADEAARLTQGYAAQQNKPLSNPDTVVARLAEKGWLVTERTGGKTRYRSRRTLEGVRRTNLLAFDALVFWPPDDQGRD